MENNIITHKIGDKVVVTITAIKPYGAFCDLQDGGSGLIHISEIDDKYISNVSSYLKVGSVHMALVIGIGTKPNNYSLSTKRLIRRPRQVSVQTIKPLGRRDYNKKRIDRISYAKTSASINSMVESEYQRLKGGNQ